MARWAKRDYVFAADIIREGDCGYGARTQVAFCLRRFAKDNPKFDGKRFIKYAYSDPFGGCYNSELRLLWARLRKGVIDDK